MSRSPVLTTLAVTLLAAFTFAVAVLMGSDLVRAEPGNTGGGGSTCTCPDPQQTPDRPRSLRPKFAGLEHGLDESDEIAALDAVRVALTEVGDGSTFVWHRANGRLSGVFQPTTSFKDGAGNVCRRLKVTLSAGSTWRTTHGTACRNAAGVWALMG